MKSIFIRLLLSTNLFYLGGDLLIAQYTTEWRKTIGGSDPDHINSVCFTKSGDILAAGESYSSDYLVTGYHGDYGSDGWVTKLTSEGEVLWSRCYGSEGNDVFYSVIPLEDGSCIATGYAEDESGDVSVNNGSADPWAVMLDPSGNLMWEHAYGDSSCENAFKIIPSGDGNYFLICYTTVEGEGLGYFDFSDDYLIIKIQPSGEVIWQKTFGGTSFERPFSAAVDADHNIIIPGYAMSDDGDVIGHTFFGDADAWFLKTDSLGNILNSVCYGGLMYETYNDIITASNDGFLLLSTSLTEGETCNDPSQYDYQLCKTDENGMIEWQKCYGGAYYDWGYRIVNDIEGYFIGGTTLSTELPGFHAFGEYDFYVVKLDQEGNLTWQYCYGGSGLEGYGVDIASDNAGGFVLGGTSESSDGDNTTPLGSSDGIIIKITCDGAAEIFSAGETEICTTDSVTLYTPYIPAATWKWLKNGEEIPLANDTSFTCYEPGNYQVQVFLPSNCIKLSETISVTDTCAIEEMEEIPFGIYPNPSAGTFSISCYDEKECDRTYDISIYSINGHLVRTIHHLSPNTEVQLNVALRQGYYIIVIQGEDGTHYQLPCIVSF